LTVEGHADERGTREYNIALGEKRANSVKEFLVAQGVQASRLKTVSYGKERPAVLGSNETAWAQNRRGVGVIAQ
ncbi:MAG TPA: OmpA family protein, partial [Candidatus Sulfotelmatobacter sp.]|nr:OmpA family protein [Candidatus Sulfotelmatobacter sp.]